eukprot:TRINITY_DN66951_c2_g6_i1.p1 TRINITY_DN66951_c2_g6~~TRINITY_DN66951_c2_g6_i1.p1  ORF type:complete len:281 (-),score=32.07 TRINITY_DN66951_c2_g6_i1:196-1008(-)
MTTKHEENVRSTTASGSTVYESAKAVDEYLQFHFATAEEFMPYSDGPKDALEFPKRCAEACIETVKSTGATAPTRALDIGCAVGRSTFELTTFFDEAIGIDFSHAFIEAANKMKTKKQLPYLSTQEGQIQEERVANIPEACKPENASFEQGDACNLREGLGEFDVIMAANLLCRLPEPRQYLARLPALTKKGGFAIFFSPYSWLPEYTAKDKWLGGYEKDGKPVQSFDVLKDIMSENFEFVSEKNMPFLIREHIRKFQWGCSHCTVWKRK